jgi:hypothetical protein
MPASYFVVLPDGIGHGRLVKAQRRCACPLSTLWLSRHGRGPVPAVDKGLQSIICGWSWEHRWAACTPGCGARAPRLHGRAAAAGLAAVADLRPQRVWRRIISDAIRNDPEWRGGEYQQQPRACVPPRRSVPDGSNPLLRWQEMPTLAASDALLDAAVGRRSSSYDANDTLYQIEASGITTLDRLWNDSRPAAGAELGRRSDQPAGARNFGARDPARSARPRSAGAIHAREPRTREPDAGGGLETSPAAAAAERPASLGRPPRHSACSPRLIM